ncbi:UNVERIFIED_CONTAM: hypothetical protein KB568_10935, partial [Streptococcus canis]
FEGPLDLLLHLVSKYKVDIYEVPIVEVIEQYLAYIETLQAMNEVIALFLASLELIKMHLAVVEQATNFGPIVLRKEMQ